MAPLPFQPLTDDEIQKFWDALDHNDDGAITLGELEKRLEKVHEELSPKPMKHNLNHPDRKTPKSEKPEDRHSSDLHDFLCGLMTGCGETMDKGEFVRLVKSWNIPSQNQDGKDEKQDAVDYQKTISRRRKLRAWWSVRGPEVAFLAFVVALQLAFGIWQFVKYLTYTEVRNAMGWGPVVAKMSAGVLYPTLFFMILSMSRWFATFCRKSYIVSRFINWDYSQSFHIKMAIIATFFATLHAIGHLTGTFLDGSRPERQGAVALLLGGDATPMSYGDYVRTLPGWTGLTALSCFYVIGATSSPWVRKKSYEIFQLAHLLMYPMFGVLAAHGVRAILQFPMLGYWLVFPVLLVLAERSTRAFRTFFVHHPARLEALDDGTVVITAEKPEGTKWKAHAGQYVFVQVPGISRFQWHPFTISACIGSRLQVHIKADGNWTSQLHELATKSKKESANGEEDFVRIKVGIDGPFGAPAQRFYTYDKAIIVGAGIGVTPFSAILTDLEENYKAQGDPWKLTRTRSFGKRTRTRTRQPNDSTPGLTPSTSRNAGGLAPPPARGGSTPVRENSNTDSERTVGEERKVRHKKCLQDMRRSRPGSYQVPRVDFHWSVRDKTDLLWFSDLLNRASRMADSDAGEHLTLNIHAHVTQKRKDISEHVFRYLLDSYRTPEYPYSALTGLRASSHFGRPDFERILSEFFEDMKAQGWQGRIGVFACGPPVISEQLADICEQLTQRARSEGYGMRFIMQIEVFN